MPCRECQDQIRSATCGLYRVLKPYRRVKIFNDQDWVLMLAYLRKIEKQVASKEAACNSSG